MTQRPPRRNLCLSQTPASGSRPPSSLSLALAISDHLGLLTSNNKSRAPIKISAAAASHFRTFLQRQYQPHHRLSPLPTLQCRQVSLRRRATPSRIHCPSRTPRSRNSIFIPPPLRLLLLLLLLLLRKRRFRRQLSHTRPRRRRERRPRIILLLLPWRRRLQCHAQPRLLPLLLQIHPRQR